MHGLALLALASLAPSDDVRRFQPMDVFALEHASDPRISPDGSSVVYVRTSFDVMQDRSRTQLWHVPCDGSDARPLTEFPASARGPRWSPDGTRLAYVARGPGGGGELFVRWMDEGQTTSITQLEHAPRTLAWSPDGRWLAFIAHVPERRPTWVDLPSPPAGATWAAPAHVVEHARYRADGRGPVEPGHDHVFVVPAHGGTPRQLTSGPYPHRNVAWTPDGQSLVVSGQRMDDWEFAPRNSDLYEVDVHSGALHTLTNRDGPDHSPTVSPDGRTVAYLGYDDAGLGYQVNRIHLLNRRTGESRTLAADLDRSVSSIAWTTDGDALIAQFDDQGRTLLARIGLDGTRTPLVDDVGGNTLGRPYASGSFTASGSRIAYTACTSTRPADVVLHDLEGTSQRLTDLHTDVASHRDLARIEEVRYASSHDGRPIQGWIAYPPDYEPGRAYPLILEIHGGPFANYGPRFSAEVQLFAAAGYVVLYTNPRGSTSYGEAFGNLIHHDYPNHDLADLMTGVDVLVERGIADPERLFVTGGSGGGVLTAWIVGHTTRFRAAVVAKPVINWTSFALTSDGYMSYSKYWFPGFPWDHPEHFHRRSPLSRAGHIETPTMLLTGEADLRTPIGESEQLYQALTLRRIPTALVRVPGASHGIAARPSHLISKVAHILGWFERYDVDTDEGSSP